MKFSELLQYLNSLSGTLKDSELSDELIEHVVQYLKKQVDRYRFIDASVSVEVANQIIAIGICENNLSHQALGHMAKGDSLEQQGKINEAWDELKLAEALYLQAEDDVGWARTRIGLINVSKRKGKVYRDAILKDLERAHSILIENGYTDKSIVLTNNTAASYNAMGDNHKALETYLQALEKLQKQDSEIQNLYLGMIYQNLGVTYGYLGSYQEALDAHALAHQIFTENQQHGAILRSQNNSAFILLRLGRYAQAIRHLHAATSKEEDHNIGEFLITQKTLITCYIGVGKYEGAIVIAKDIQAPLRELGNHLTLLDVLINTAVAQAELRHFDEALTTLEEAQQISYELEAEYWRGEIHRLRSKVYISQNKTEEALAEAETAAKLLKINTNPFETCSLYLVIARSHARLGQYGKAQQHITKALKIAEQERFLSIQSDAYLLFAQMHEYIGDGDEAIKNYQQAASIVDYTVQTLTLTLRTDFLARNGTAHQQLAMHHLEDNNAEAALSTIEKIKAHLHLTYLIQHDQLRWQQNKQTKARWEELDQLRQDYHQEDTAPPEERDARRLDEIARQIESLREHLYLSTEQNGQTASRIPTLAEIQQRIGQSELLVTYYETPDCYYAILITNSTEACIPLGDTRYCQRLISLCYQNFNAVLRSSLKNINLDSYLATVQTFLERLYKVLIEPFSDLLDGISKLWVVPYGSLHKVPFGALYHEGRYLIQNMEIALLPYAGQITLHNQDELSHDVTILSHSFNQQVPMRLNEGRMVAEHFDTQSHEEQNAHRDLIYQACGQLLHIAAHAQFRLDHPDLSYIQLGDGKLYVDELFQQKIPVELVVLSACETGQAKVAPGDELLGLGRGFLYSGVHSLVVSLWRVADSYTYQLMTHFYDTLLSDEVPSKSKALQLAQCHLLEENPNLHPVLWSAFQFIGDSRPIKRI